MFKLTVRNFDVIHWGGVPVELNLSFDNVLLMFDMFEDKTVPDKAKPNIALSMLVVDNKLLEQLNSSQKEQLLVDIFKQKFDMDLNSKNSKNTLTENNSSQSGAEQDGDNFPDVPIVDFTLDAERIFSSFLFDYGINLIHEQGKLLWSEFMALFNNLSENTAMKIAIKYRTCEIPKKTKHNEDEVKHIKKMKELYELPEAKRIREERAFIAFKKQMELTKELYRQQGLAVKAHSNPTDEQE
ncbi:MULTISPECIES: Gp15 family bacteriophage protein [Bacillus cereus group]|uniref:Gp15 family bacteriophage protein n=1 Tax=Bacillus cereus group TaxID=86661 RepID=UPI00397BF90C